MIKRLLKWFVGAVLLALLGWWCLPQPAPPLQGVAWSRVLLDREGRLLRVGLSADEKYRLPVRLEEVSPALLATLLAQEDQHFYRHPGINPGSTLRALAHWCLGRTGYGGASTLTMQLVRLRYRFSTRTVPGKLRQMWLAACLERHYPKRELLEAYLSLAPFGRNLEGVRAASWLLYGKPPAELTRAEAVVLAVLPQSPTRRARHTPALQAAAARLGLRVGVAPAALTFPTARLVAPHFTQRLLAAGAEGRTTLDRPRQTLLERRLAQWLATRRGEGLTNAAALLVDTDDMAVLAHLGSADFWNPQISGQVDGTHSRRSPGSALKPFIYALAMDQGLIHPRTLLADAPHRFGEYQPENFDRTFAGPLPASEALVRSRNVPAVALAERLAHPTFYEFLRTGGVALPHAAAAYGLTLPLGGGEVTMEELVRLYAALAHGGRLRPLRILAATPQAPGPRLLSPEAAFLTLEMLGHVPRPDLNGKAGAGGIAWKTGTSMGFHDAWAVAVFDHYVLAVWVGNFNGRANPALVGRTCAGPLLFQMIDALRAAGFAQPRPLVPPPGLNLRRVELCAISGQPPTAACTHRCSGWFIPGVSPIRPCAIHREILVDATSGLRLARDDGTRPLRRAVYEFWPSDLRALFAQAGLPRRQPPPFAPGESLTAGLRAGAAPHILSPAEGRACLTTPTLPLTARAEGDVRLLYWFAGPTFLGTAAPGAPLPWPATPGTYRLTVLDDQGRSATRQVEIAAAGR